MKKLLCMILALIMVMSLCACGQENPDNTSGDNTTDSSGVQQSQDTTVKNDDTESNQPVELKDIQQITFTINGTKFHLGMKLSELIDSGVFTNITSKDETLSEVEAGGATATLGAEGECKIHLYLWNLSRNEIDIEDATVVGLYYSLGSGNEAITTMLEDVSLSGVKLNTSIDDITDIFGKPNHHEKTYEGEDSRGGGWRGFDIGEEFRLYIVAEQPTGQPLSYFSLEFKPFADNIK